MRRFDRVLGTTAIIPPKTAHAGRNPQDERDISRLWFRGAGLSIMPLLIPESGVRGHVGVVVGVPPGPPRLSIQGHRRTAWSGSATGKPRSLWPLKRSTSSDGFVSSTSSCGLDLETVPTVTFDPTRTIAVSSPGVVNSLLDAVSI